MQNYTAKNNMSLIFMHIPKTAGRTFITILDNEYDQKEIYNIYRTPTREAIIEFKKLPEDQRKKYRLVKGHIGYGLHNYLNKPARYITLIRDPINRIISHYYYVLRNPNHYLYHQVTSKKMNLEDYVTSKITKEVDNGQIRFFAGCDGHPSDYDFGQCTEELYYRAIENLQKHFFCFGITERFDETILLMRKRLKWEKTPFYLRQNVNKDRPKFKDIPKHVIMTIHEYNLWDMKLYIYVTKHFDTFLKDEIIHEKDVKKFIYLNRIYQYLHKVKNKFLN